MNVVKQEMNTDSSFFDGAITSFVSLVSIAQSGDKDMFLGAAIWMVQCMADANHTIPHKASCGKRSLRVLTQLIHKSFLLNHFISSANTGWNTFSISSRLLWSPNKEVQLLACTFMAALTKSFRENDPHCHPDFVEKWCSTDLIPPLVQLLAHDGPTRMPATMVCTELVRYRGSVANTFVQANGIQKPMRHGFLMMIGHLAAVALQLIGIKLPLIAQRVQPRRQDIGRRQTF